jgi:hypothetical protein
MKTISINLPKAAGAIVLAAYGAYCAFRPSEWHVIDGVNLVAHEAGHLLLGWFGQFIGIAGGTLGQLFVPAAFTVYFFLQRAQYSSSVTLFWLGQSLVNVSVYVKDARAMELPLVSVGGGGDAIHDWHWLLSKFGLLAWDQLVGNFILAVGIGVMLAGAAAALFSSLHPLKQTGCGGAPSS